MYPRAIDPSALARGAKPKSSRWSRWLFIGASLFGLLLASYLTTLKLTGRITDLAGCGGESGCGDVLGGQWANWLRIPISFWAVTIYLPLLTLGILGLTTSGRRKLALMGTSLLVAGAIWFLFLQAAVVGHFCMYCGLLHACGLIAFGCVMSQVWSTELSERATSMMASGIFATLTMVALVTGQVFGPVPPTHEITTEDGLGPDVASTTDMQNAPTNGDTDGVHGKGVLSDGTSIDATAGVRRDDARAAKSASEGMTTPADTTPADTTPDGRSADPLEARPGDRVVEYFDGAIQYPVQRMPLIGRPDARHVLVKYFDYTCRSCRRMHDDLALVIEQYPNDLCVIVIPCPLNVSCNPYAEQKTDASGREAHQHSCELARIALAVWRANPKEFASFHDTMFARQGTITPVGATIIAESAVGLNEFRSAMADPWVEAVLNHSINVYSRMKRRNPRMPKLLLGGRKVLHGVVVDQMRFLQELRRLYHLAPPTS